MVPLLKEMFAFFSVKQDSFEAVLNVQNTGEI